MWLIDRWPAQHLGKGLFSLHLPKIFLMHLMLLNNVYVSMATKIFLLIRQVDLSLVIAAYWLRWVSATERVAGSKPPSSSGKACWDILLRHVCRIYWLSKRQPRIKISQHVQILTHPEAKQLNCCLSVESRYSVICVQKLIMWLMESWPAVSEGDSVITYRMVDAG